VLRYWKHGGKIPADRYLFALPSRLLLANTHCSVIKLPSLIEGFRKHQRVLPHVYVIN